MKSTNDLNSTWTSRRLRLLSVSLWFATLAVAACSSESSDGEGTAGAVTVTGGSSASGGASTTGGAVSGGAQNLGGATRGGASNGGAIGAGGAHPGGTTGAGGLVAVGGIPGTGGLVNLGGAGSGGLVTTGGVMTLGGWTGDGGLPSTGGVIGEGGSTTLGGATNLGGAAGTAQGGSQGGDAGTGQGGDMGGSAGEGEGGTAGEDMGGSAGEATGGSAGNGAGGAAAGYCPTTPGEPCKIMPVGDSITEGCCMPGSGGYREQLFRQTLTNNKNITFVGSAQENGPQTIDGQPFPRKHEGHGGWKINQIADIIDGSIASSSPHIVLLMIGTNDINGMDDLNNAPNRLESLMTRITDDAPDALLVVSSAIPMKNERDSYLQTYNTTVKARVESAADAGKHVIFVDNYATFSEHPNYGSEWMADDLHPNAAGYEALGDAFYEVISDYLPDAQ